MKVICPGCQFTQVLNQDEIPVTVVTVTCPECSREFSFDPAVGEQSPDQASFTLAPESEQGADQVQEEAGSSVLPAATQGENRHTGATPPPAESSGKILPPPFEDRENYDFFAGFFKTIGRVISAPHDFFKGVGEYEENGLMRPYIFAFLIFGLPLALFSLIFIPIIGVAAIEESPEAGLILFAVALGVVILTPLFLAVSFFIGAGIIHLLLLLFQGANRGFATTFRCYCYSLTIMLFGFIPFVGGIAGIVQMVYLIIGLAQGHNTSYGKAIGAVLTPFAVLFLFGFIVPLFFIALAA